VLIPRLIIYPSAILVVNVIGGLLEPARMYLSQLCMTNPNFAPTKKSRKEKKKKKHQ
jgi:hypothetical protein